MIGLAFALDKRCKTLTNDSRPVSITYGARLWNEHLSVMENGKHIGWLET